MNHVCLYVLPWEIHERETNYQLRRILAVLYEPASEPPLPGPALWGWPKLALAADSWFAGEDFFQELTELEVPFVIEIRSNRIVERHGRQNVELPVDQYMSNRPRGSIYHNEKTKYGCEGVLMLRDAKTTRKVVAVTNSRDLALSVAPVARQVGPMHAVRQAHGFPLKSRPFIQCF